MIITWFVIKVNEGNNCTAGNKAHHLYHYLFIILPTTGVPSIIPTCG